MQIDDFMNPNRRDVQADYFIPAGTQLDTLHSDSLNTEMEYIGIKDADGIMTGAIRTERLRYILTCNEKLPLGQILDHLNIGVIAIDLDSRIFYVNPAYSTILDIPCGKIIGRYMNQIERNAALLNVLASRQCEQREKQLIQSVNKYVSVNMFPLYQNGQCVGACSLFTDITELNHLSNEVVRISQVAEEYNRQIQMQDFLKNQHIIGESIPYMNCIRRALLAARTDASVLIRGENGAGKEVICKIIQENGDRKNKPFIKVNCAAIPESLIESELFGYEEGAFTGAKKGGRIGKFQLAEGGTIFLDEIGDIPLAMQAKLLRVLQENEIERVGGQGSIPIDVRVIAATNQPLEQMIQDGKFRMDLYYRLNVVKIEIPALRERGNDIILLADEFLQSFNRKYSQNKSFSKDVYRFLLEYPWPGNVRELRNLVESCVVLSEADIIVPGDLPESIRQTYPAAASDTYRHMDTGKALPAACTNLKASVGAFEKKMILDTLAHFNGNRRQAIEALQISRRTFYRKLAEYGINESFHGE